MLLVAGFGTAAITSTHLPAKFVSLVACLACLAFLKRKS